MITNDEIFELERLLELDKIDEAREDFWSFCTYMDVLFFNEGKQHLKTVANALQQVSEGDIKKLMVSMPPRAGKSYIVSMWNAWSIGRDSKASFMRNTYGYSLAQKFSYDVRAIVQKELFLNVFPEVRLKGDKKAVDDWAIEGSEQSSYFCAGIGGAITGKGCRTAAILDDPIKNLEDALSETMLDKTWSWYMSTHKSRMEKDCPEIHIATRWSKKDPIGMLLDLESEKWTQIVIPALIDGKSFCEEIKTTEEYLETKNLLDESIWESEYMQKPVESKGLLFPIDSLNRFALKELHDTSDFVGYVDTADEGTDNLCSIIGATKGENVYLVDVIFTQDPIEVTEALVAEQVIKYAPYKTITESNFGGKSFAKNVKEIIKRHNDNIRSESKKEPLNRTIVKWKANTQNKETRILMKSGQIKKYFHFRNDYKIGSDYDRYMRELTGYVKMGKNKKDDAPDATTGLADMVFIKKIGFLT